MLPILLMVLKIAGIVILAFLGLVFLVLLLVLFVPVRYSVSGSYCEKPKGSLQVTWLLGAVSVRVTYEDRPDAAVRILGMRLFQKGRETGTEQKGSHEAGRVFGEDGAPLRVDYVETAGEETGEESGRTDREKVGKEAGGTAGEEAGNTAQEAGGKTAEDDGLEQRREETDGGIRFYGADPEEEEFEDWFEEEESLKGKRTLKSGKASVSEKLKGIIRSARDGWNRASEYKDKGLAFWNDDENQKTIRLVIRQAKAIVRHVLPVKIRGKAVFGFDDPGITGKVLAAMSVVYGMYGDQIQVVPVFDRKVLEAEGSLKGRVQAGVIGARCVRVLLNKNFRRLLRSLIRNGGR